MNTDSGKPRIVIYGTGNFGQYFARIAAQKNWPVVAAYNRAGPKVGQDLGRLAGLDRDLGVIVQDCDTASYDKIDADVTLVSTADSIRTNMPAYNRLMGAGLNILGLAGEACYPQGIDSQLAEEIDTLAKRNNVTFTGGGIWAVSRIWPGILATGPLTELKSMYHRSITDTSRQLFSKAQAYNIAIGIPEQDFWDKGYATNSFGLLYKTIPQHIFHAIGYTVTNTSIRVEPIVFDVPMNFHLFEEPIPAGYSVGIRIICDCETKEGVTAKVEIEIRLCHEGEVEHMLWSVKGRPEINIRVERNDSAHVTAGCLFNRIPDVIGARPGIVLISEMGPLKHTALV